MRGFGGRRYKVSGAHARAHRNVVHLKVDRDAEPAVVVEVVVGDERARRLVENLEAIAGDPESIFWEVFPVWQRNLMG